MRKLIVPTLLFGVLVAAALTVSTVVLPGNTTATVTASKTVLNGTTYIVRTIVYNNNTVTDTITVVPGSPNAVQLRLMLNKANTTTVLPITVRVQMRAGKTIGMTNSTMAMNMSMNMNRTASAAMSTGMGGMGTQGTVHVRTPKVATTSAMGVGKTYTITTVVTTTQNAMGR